MDERDRNKFYSPPEPSDDDDGEYELEPLDPAVVSAEQKHASEVAEQVRASIDIDDVYREAERSGGAEQLENFVRNFKYRFHIKHVLFATALMAITIAIAKLGYLVPAMMFLVSGSVAGLYLYVNWQDRKQQAEADAKRDELYARRRAQLLANRPTPTTPEPLLPPEPVPVTTPTSDATTTMWDEPPPPEPFRIQFSMQSLFIAMTIAAVSFGLISLIGGPAPMATILGLVAVGGLLAHATGFDPPQTAILAWWLILLLYVILTLLGAVWSGTV